MLHLRVSVENGNVLSFVFIYVLKVVIASVDFQAHEVLQTRRHGMSKKFVSFLLRFHAQQNSLIFLIKETGT